MLWCLMTWWFKSLGISSHGIDQCIPEYFGLSTTWVNDKIQFFFSEKVIAGL